MFRMHSNRKASRAAGFGKVELVLWYLGVLAASSCSNYDPISTKNLLIAPNKILARFGDGFVELTWAFPGDSTQVKEYRLYRRDQTQTAFQRLSAIKTRRFRDERLTNGMRYQYQVTAVNKDGYEGTRSETITAIPAFYSLQLAGGAPYTNRRTITLTLTAPATPALMMIANDSIFAGTAWEAFAPSRAWELTAGDGLKRVFAKFRNADNQEFSGVVRAGITLDTIAGILGIRALSRKSQLNNGDTLHIRLNAVEKNGTATADLIDAVNGASAQERNISLYDDGRNGDPTPNDGVYERDYFVRTGLEVVNAYVYGRFTDAAGNVAPPAAAPDRITIQSPPIAVLLQEPTTIAGNTTALSLRWTLNTDTDFASYQIRRARNATVSLSSTLVKEITDQHTTSYIDNGLDPGTQYYYRVYVFDAAGNNTASNIAQQNTPANEAPKPVVLSQPLEDAGALKLSWSPRAENDFANYRIYRSLATPVDTAVAPLAVINNSATTEYRDTGVMASVVYYYRVFVYDRYDLSAGSNTVHGKLK